MASPATKNDTKANKAGAEQETTEDVSGNKIKKWVSSIFNNAKEKKENQPDKKDVQIKREKRSQWLSGLRPKVRYRITLRTPAGDSTDVMSIPVALIIAVALVLISACIAAIVISYNIGPTPEERLKLANTYLEQEEYVDAAGIYSDLIKDGKLLVPSYLGLANSQMARGSLEAAVESLQKGLEKTGQDAFLQERLDEIMPMLETPPAADEAGEPSVPAEDSLSRMQGPPIPQKLMQNNGLSDRMQGPAMPQKPMRPSALDVPIEWKDRELERLIRMALDIQEPTPVLQSDVAGIYSLKILGPTHAVADKMLQAQISMSGYTIGGVKYTEHGSISSLEDLTYFKGLHRLIIGFHSITSLEGLSSLASLQTVGLYFNEIESLEPLSKLPELSYLYVYNNRIGDLSALSGCKRLKQLWVQNNQITDLSPLASLPDLKELVVGGNRIRDLSPIASLSSLEYLDARGNQISDISVIAGMPALESVSFIENPVIDYTPAGNLRRINGRRVN